METEITDPVPAVKLAMGEALKGCPLSREQVVEDMNRLALIRGWAHGKRPFITPALLDKYVALGATAYVIGQRALNLFCEAVGSLLPLEAYVKTFRGVEGLLDREKRLKVEWVDDEITARQAKKRNRRRAPELGIE